MYAVKLLRCFGIFRTRQTINVAHAVQRINKVIPGAGGAAGLPWGSAGEMVSDPAAC